MGKLRPKRVALDIPQQMCSLGILKVKALEWEVPTIQ